MTLSFAVNICIILATLSSLVAEDFYKLLGVSKNADNREIRKAFKKLALKYHPDKNNEDDAHEKFLKLTRAYEILKDEETRKKYDLFGEDELGNSNSRPKYQSWNYYHDDFGIYDDDKEIVTLDSADFRRSVLESSQIWFINFYSPRCSHCHDLAPVWRRLAVQLGGVVRVGAVNCQEEFMLCRQQGITGYPTLNLYTWDRGTVKFQGRKEEEEIMAFLVSFLPDKMVDLWEGNLNKWKKTEDSLGWVVVFCSQSPAERCQSQADRRLLAAVLDGLTHLAGVDCTLDLPVCQRLRGDLEDSTMIFLPGGLEGEERIGLTSSVHDYREIAQEVLNLLPEITKLNKESFNEMRRRLDKDIGPSWLIQFTNGETGENLQYKKISGLIPRQRLGKVDCSHLAELCRDLHINKFPSFVLFKIGGGFELYYGKDNVEDVVHFTRLASQARTMETFISSDFPDLINSGQPVVIEFFAQWCPPCMNFLPEFRKASTLIGGQVSFGTVDCTSHHRVCSQHGIRSYPSTVFFNNTKPHKYQGNQNAKDLADFVVDILRPSVVSLDGNSFERMVGGKSEDEMWLVDFYAPWCGPCQQLAPEWRKLAKKLEKNPAVRVGKVDCVEERALCDKYSVTSYPTIRMYPLESPGLRRYLKYDQYHRDSTSLHQWVTSNLPSYVESLTPYLLEHNVLQGSKPWLVLFYTGWCGHCTRFKPDYEEVAIMLRSRLKVGKVNCEKYRKVCEKAVVRGYPTVRYYRGGEGQQQYTSQDIKERSPANIVNQVEALLREDTQQQPQPLEDHFDLKKIPLGEDISEDDGVTDFEDEDQNDDFIYFYEDDSAFTFNHDEL